ncbi:MAG: hypothetical protein A2Z07_09780 [Armatimonadetes bacterium RBG_16_67_12]|nr:MAG: hypothetical protein A2Z07_09780 [Armatimonadetes bacterium RBG_16_67_12]
MTMTRPAGDSTGKWLGLVVFLLGVAFLVSVFVLGYRDLAATGALGQLTTDAARESRADWWALAVKGVMLAIMMISGALIANRGIGLYAASRPADEG